MSEQWTWWRDREECKDGDEQERRKSEVVLYLVMSKTVLICSETLQRKKLWHRERDWKTTNIKKKDKTFGSFYFLPSAIACLSLVYLSTVAWKWTRTLTRTNSWIPSQKLWMAIWVTSTSYFCPIDYFVTLAGTVRLFSGRVVCCLLEPEKKERIVCFKYKIMQFWF